MFNLSSPPGFRGLHPDLPITAYHRHLPHWRQDGATYFVTFRLGDSLPQEKLLFLKRLRAKWEQKHPEPRSDKDWEEHSRDVIRRTEAWLDEGHGACYFRETRWSDDLRDRLHHLAPLDCPGLAGCRLELRTVGRAPCPSPGSRRARYPSYGLVSNFELASNTVTKQRCSTCLPLLGFAACIPTSRLQPTTAIFRIGGKTVRRILSRFTLTIRCLKRNCNSLNACAQSGNELILNHVPTKTGKNILETSFAARKRGSMKAMAHATSAKHVGQMTCEIVCITWRRWIAPDWQAVGWNFEP